MLGREAQTDSAELVLLSVLSEAPLYGYAISKTVAARSGDRITLSPGVLYPLLAKLEKQGLLTSSWEEVRSDRHAAAATAAPAAPAPPAPPGESDSDADPAARGRRRKWYRLSAKGRRRLAQAVERHRSFVQMISDFLPTPRREGAP